MALIFDFDGLVVDTETAIFQAWQELYASEGETLTLKDYIACVGSAFGLFDPIKELEKRTGREINWPERLAIKDKRIVELQQGLGPLPGVVDLLKEAQSLGIACAVASSSLPPHVYGWVRRLGLEYFFHHLTCRGDEGAQPKPKPDLFLLAAHRLGLAPEACVVLEDSHNGLQAAHAAGIACLVVPSPVTIGSDFTLATEIWPTLEGRKVAEILKLRDKS